MLNSHSSGIKALYEPSDALKNPIATLSEASTAYIFPAKADEKFYTPLTKGSSLSPLKQVSVTESGFPVFSAFYGEMGETVVIDHPVSKKIQAIKVDSPRFSFSLPTPKFDIDAYSPNEIIECAKKAGIVDETDGERLYKKLLRIRSGRAKILVGNALADTPYDAAKTALLRAYGENIASALTLAAFAVGASKCCIAVFDGKKAPAFPQSIGNVPLMKINFRYPAMPLLNMQIRGWGGGEQIGVGALFALYYALSSHLPQTFVCLTVDGTAVLEPKNIFVPIGVTVSDVVRECILSENIHHFCIGSVMSGVSCLPETPVTPEMTCIIVNDLEKQEAAVSCVGCSECVSVCPKKLLPIHIMTALERGNSSTLTLLNPELCIGCGCCSFVCPSRIDLMHSVLKAKETVLNDAQKGGEEDESI